MPEYVELNYKGKQCKLPVINGTEGEKAIDISNLRQDTGFITLDVGYGNTGSCRSTITFMDGENGILRYRGIPVEQLAEHATFKETAYLLIHGRLPTWKEHRQFSVLLNDHSLVHEDIGRLPGWIAQWLESMNDPHWKLCRPRQIYTGPEKTDYVPFEQR